MAMDKAAQRRVLDEIARDAGFVVDLDPTFDEDGALRHNLQPDVASDHTVEVVIPADAQTVPYVENVYTDGFNHLISSSVTKLGDRNQRGTVIADAIDRFTVASSPAVDGYDFDADVQRLKDVYAESGTLDSGISFRDKGYMGVTELVVQSDSYAQDYYTLDTDVHGDMRARLQTYQGIQPRDAVEISSKDNPYFADELHQLVNDYNVSAEKNHAAQMFFDRLGPEGVAEYLDTGDYVREDLTNLGTVREELLFDEDVVAAIADHAGRRQREEHSAEFRVWGGSSGDEVAAYEASLSPLTDGDYSTQIGVLDKLAYDVNAHMESHSYVKDVQGNIRREFDREPGVDSRLALVLPADGGSPYVEARYYDEDGIPWFDARSLDDPATAMDEFNKVAHEYTLAAQGREFASSEHDVSYDEPQAHDNVKDTANRTSVAERVQRLHGVPDAPKQSDTGFTFG